VIARLRAAAPAVLVAILAAAPFAGTLDFPFLHDDRWAVLSNPNVTGGFDLGRVLTTDSWGGQPGYTHMHYRPLSSLTIAVTAAAAGLDPAPFRATNVLLHVAASLLVLALARRLGVGLLAATAAAGWFALHPVHAETVQFVVNREELLATSFCLGAAILLVRDAPWTPARLAGLAALALLGLASKETAVCLPLLAAGLALAFRPGTRPGSPPGAPHWWLRWMPALVLLAAVVAFVGLRYAVLGRVLSDFIPWQDNPLVRADAAGRATGALAVLGHAAGLLAAPLRQTVDYGWDVLGLPADGLPPAAIAGIGVAIAAIAAFAASLRRAPAVATGILLAAVAYAPFSNVAFLNSILLSERNLYLAAAGVAVAAGAALDLALRVGPKPAGLLADGRRRGPLARPIWRAARRPIALLSAGARVKSPSATATSAGPLGHPLAPDCVGPAIRVGLAAPVATAITIAWVAAFGALVADRASDFRSAEALFASSLASRPGSTRLHDNLGVALQDAGRLDEAEREFRRALAIDGENVEAHNNLGTVLQGRGDLAGATAEYVEALRLRPGMRPAAGNLCVALSRAGDPRAAEWCREARRIGAVE